MAHLTVTGLDRRACDEVARRLRLLARRAALRIDVDVATDALDVQRVGKLGACSVIAGGQVVAHTPLPDDSELEKRLAGWTTTADATAA